MCRFRTSIVTFTTISGLLLAAGVVAQEPAHQEILSKLEVSDAVTSDSTDLLGDRIDLFTGSLSFYQTDVVLPGNDSLVVAVGRTYRGIGYSYRHGAEFGDWALNIPSISTVTAASGVLNGGWKNDRCSGGLSPLPARSNSPSYHWFDEEEFWNGVNLNTTDGQTRKVIEEVKIEGDPAPNAIKFPPGTALATRDLWKITCIADIGGGQGEGFIATSPAGTKYTFDKLIVLPATIIVSGGYFLPRQTFLMVATKVEDPWGNYVDFTYTGTQLTSITASDGRSITIVYNLDGFVETVQAAGRTWTYTYTAADRLDKVILPDLREWQFALNGIGNLKPMPNNTLPELCAVEDGNRKTGSGSITHPNGLVGTFDVEEKTHGRTQVPFHLIQETPSSTPYPAINHCFDTVSVKKKTLTGPGIGTLVWDYSYDEDLGSFDNEPPAADTHSLTIQAPDGSQTVYHHDRSFTWSEGALVKTEVKSLAGVTLRSVTNDYQSVYVGNWDLLYQNVAADGQIQQLDQTTLQQEGDSYFTDYLSYDDYGNPTQILRNNDINTDAITETHSYVNGAAEWVLGLPDVQTVNSVVAADNDYCTASAGTCKIHNPQTLKRFGATVTSFEYGADATVSKITDGAGNAYQFSNYKRGIPQVINIPGVTPSLTAVINNDGTVASKTDPKGNQYGYAYDGAGRLSNIGYPPELGQAYWADLVIDYAEVDTTDLAIPGGGLQTGQWKQVVTRGDYRRTRYLDALFRAVLVMEEDLTAPALTRFVVQDWDHDNRNTFTSYPSASAGETDGTATTYDALGRMLTVTDPSGTTTTEYLPGNKVRVTNPRLNVTTYEYQAFDQPSHDAVTAITQPEGVITTIGRDDFGKMTSATQGGFTRTYDFDGRERLCRTFDPETGYTDTYIDNAGNLIWELRGSTTDYCDSGNTTGPSGSTRFFYNGRNLITAKDYPTGTTDLGFGYDDNGNLTSATRGGVVWSYDYNSLDLPDFERLNLDTKQFELRYIYDTLGAVLAMDYPSNRIIDYLPNAFGQATQVGQYATGVAFHPSGLLSAFSYGNNKTFTQTENSSRLPQDMDIPGVTDLTHLYDANKNVTSITDAIRPSHNKVLGYDGLDRLTSASGPWGSGSFSYDAVGNIRTKTLGTDSYTLNYDTSNRLDTVTGANAYQFEYDSHGNVINNGHFAFGYDKANQLLTVNSNLAVYDYDAHSRRVKVNDAAGLVYQFYSQGGKLLFKSEASSNEPSDYLYLAGKQIARIDGVPGPQGPVTPAYIDVPAADDDGNYVVSWQAVAGATGYTLEENQDSVGFVAVYTGGSTSKSFTGKASGHYQYRIMASNANGGSPFRDSRFFDVEIAAQPPPVPTGLNSPACDLDGNFTVSWNASTGADSYVLEDSHDGAPFTVRYTGANTAYPGSWAWGVWDFRVKACNTGGCSSWSGISITGVGPEEGCGPPPGPWD